MVARKRYTHDSYEPHGIRELVRYYVEDQPDTRRSYGRRFIRGIAAGCARCLAADSAIDRASKARRAYARRR